MFKMVFGAFNNVFDVNSSNLSGTIDIVICEDQKGVRKGTNFHARFGKLKALKTKGKGVKILVNGFPTYDLKTDNILDIVKN